MLEEFRKSKDHLLNEITEEIEFEQGTDERVNFS